MMRRNANSGAHYHSNTEQRTVAAFGTVFNNVTPEVAAEQIFNTVDQSYRFIVTPNAAHVVSLFKDPYFRSIYHNAWMRLCDSQVIRALLRLEGQRIHLCTGADLTACLFHDRRMKSHRIAIVGSDTAGIQVLREQFGLRNLHHYRPPMNFVDDEAEVQRCVEFVARTQARLVFLAVGSPQQEILAQRLQNHEGLAGVALCVGASIDFLTGAQQRAPAAWQRFGMEWAYRLSREPGRLWRRYLVHSSRIFTIWLRDFMRNGNLQ